MSRKPKPAPADPNQPEPEQTPAQAAAPAPNPAQPIAQPNAHPNARPVLPTIRYDDNPAAPQAFADEAVGFWLHNGVVMLTLTSTHIDHHSSPGPVTRQVVARIVMPVAGAQGLAAGLYNFLKKNGLDPVPRSPDETVQ